MSGIAFRDGAIEIEASIVAQGLELEPSSIQALMRKGEITSLSERGVNENAGRLPVDILPQEPAFSPHRRRVWNHHPAVNHQLWRSATTRNRAQAWRVSGGLSIEFLARPGSLAPTGPKIVRSAFVEVE